MPSAMAMHALTNANCYFFHFHFLFLLFFDSGNEDEYVNHFLFHSDQISIGRACVSVPIISVPIPRKVRAHTAGASFRRQPPAPPSEREHARGRRRRGARRPNHASASERWNPAGRPACCGVLGGGRVCCCVRRNHPGKRRTNGRISSAGAEAETATTNAAEFLLARQSARNQKRFQRSIRTHAREDRSGVNGG